MAQVSQADLISYFFPDAQITAQQLINFVESVLHYSAAAGFAPVAHAHTKSEVGLGNVDNTADASKPVSTAQAAADTAARDAAITTLRAGVVAAGDNLAKLYALIQALQAIVTDSTPDGDAFVDTVQELLTVFATYPEGTDLWAAVNGKEPSIGSKGTAFNKNFGTAATDVAPGNAAVPAGGTAGQALIKSSNTDYATTWGTAAGSAQTFQEWVNGDKRFYSSLISLSGFNTTTANGGSTVSTAAVGREGVALLTTGAAANGQVAIYRGVNTSAGSYRTGQNGKIELHIVLQIPTLSDATQAFEVGFGLFENMGTGSAAPMIGFYYSNADGAFWVCKTKTDSAETKTVTTQAVVAGSWYWLSLIPTNTQGSAWEFRINNTVVATINTNITTLHSFYPSAYINKTVGTTSRSLRIDDWMDIISPSANKI